jgi:hypothetical protein
MSACPIWEFSDRYSPDVGVDRWPHGASAPYAGTPRSTAPREAGVLSVSPNRMSGWSDYAGAGLWPSREEHYGGGWSVSSKIGQEYLSSV